MPLMLTRPALAAALALSLCGLSVAPHSAIAAGAAPSVAWLEAAADADVERAFAQGKAERKPVLVYWGAQ